MYEGAPTFMASFVTFAARLHVQNLPNIQFSDFFKMKWNNKKKRGQSVFENYKTSSVDTDMLHWKVWGHSLLIFSCISFVKWGWNLEHFLSFWEVMLGASSEALTDRKEQSHWSRIQNGSHYMDSSTPYLIKQVWKSRYAVGMF